MIGRFGKYRYPSEQWFGYLVLTDRFINLRQHIYFNFNTAVQTCIKQLTHE